MIYSIPAGVAFVDAVAKGLLARWQSEPLQLSRALVLLPTRRACRSLREAFLRQSEGAALLLPRMVPLGDLDADELILTVGAEIPPAIPARRRQMLLAQLIAKFRDEPPAQCLQLASALARFLDEVATEGANLEALEKLVPEDYSEHWQHTLRFMAPVLEYWPQILAEQNAIDPAARRSLLLRAQAAAWAAHPPEHPIIIAGSLGTVPAIADLIGVVAKLPLGEVILPGLAQEAGVEEWWGAIDLPHPQNSFKELLQAIGVETQEVQPWPACALANDAAARRELLNLALLPADKTAGWGKLAAELDVISAGAKGLRRIDCATIDEEAAAIALLLRGALEVKGQTAMLVTPDRNLGRRVAEVLARWEIAIGDSAGAPLGKTEAAVFLRLVIDYAAGEQGPVELLALLKHSMTTAGLSQGKARQLARQLDVAVRGPRPEAGLKALQAKLANDTKHDHGAVIEWLNGVDAALAPLLAVLARKTAMVGDLLTTHVAAAEALATSDTLGGPQRLWRGDMGESVADWVAEVLAAAPAMAPLEPRHYAEVFMTLLADASFRSRYGEHPRLAILGPLEAQLQQADLVILGGLNEGIWPAPPAPDPWLSRPMRKNLGLSLPERRMGQEALDFYRLAAAPNVVMTRAKRLDGAPTVPSRWLQRLDMVLTASAVKAPYEAGVVWAMLAAELDAGAAPLSAHPPPAPSPPVAMRPRKLSATQIERLLVDPYEIYARKILQLDKLDELDAEADGSDRGVFLHKVFERFLKQHGATVPADAREKLLQIGREEFEQQRISTAARGLWWPRFERMVDWFIEQQRQRHGSATPALFEERGAWHFNAPAGPFEVTAKADRIDRLADGTIEIIDYKSSKPDNKSILDGRSSQLALEALIAAAGGYANLGKCRASALSYWAVTGGNPPGTIVNLEELKGAPPLAEQLATAEDGLKRLISAFDNPEMPYTARPNSRIAPIYSDYGLLERVKEWGAVDEDDEEGSA